MCVCVFVVVVSSFFFLFFFLGGGGGGEGEKKKIVIPRIRKPTDAFFRSKIIDFGKMWG